MTSRPWDTTPRELQLRLQAEGRGRPFIEYRDTDGQVLYELPSEGRVSIGRDEETDISLGFDAEVSRIHAELARLGRGWVVADDGLSRNGTFVDGERVLGRRRLEDGATIRVGATAILYRDPAVGATSQTAAPPERATLSEITLAQRRVLLALCRPFRDGSEFATPATNKRIADELSLSTSTVKAHLRALFERFDVGDLPQNDKRIRLVALAMRSGAVTPRDLDSPP